MTARWTARLTVLAPLPALAAVALLTTGCSDEPSYFGAAHVESNVAYTRPTEEEAASGAEIVGDVAAQLYQPITAEAGDGNVAYSPLSIATVLAMTRTGAKGDSASQLDEFLGTAGQETTEIGRSVNGAADAVRQQAGPVQLDSGEMGEIELTNANAVWGQSGSTWEPDFLDDMRTSFDTGVWTADFAADPEQARYEINDWVAMHTREHIKNLLPKGSITDATRLTLTNAVFFKAPWPGELDDAGKEAFTTAAGKEVQASMLKTDGDLAYQSGDGWTSVALPYAGKDLAMTLLVPDAGKLAEVEAGLDATQLHDVLTGGKPTPVAVTFPKFDLDQRSAVGDALKELGVTAPFTTDTDFEPMSTDPDAQPLHLSNVLHQATVTVDEHGTEAAAATAAVFETVSAMVPDEELVVDRPFLFIIHDIATGTPIFLGRVTDPTTK